MGKKLNDFVEMKPIYSDILSILYVKTFDGNSGALFSAIGIFYNNDTSPNIDSN